MWWAISLGIILLVVLLYNNLQARRNQIGFARGSIDALLKKRHDLVPLLVKAVGTYAHHEKIIFENLVRARAEAMRYPGLIPLRFERESALASQLGQLVALAEAYPDLRASEPFWQLQRTLLELEEQIAAARRFYNAAINDYNNAVQTFPGNLLANSLGFKNQSYYTIPPIEQQAPLIRL